MAGTVPADGTENAQGLPSRPRQAVRRFSWGLADQAVSSLTNAFVSIYVARELGAVQFGAFSLAYVTYSFVLNASRGLGTDPLVVRFSGVDIPAWRRAVASASGTATVVGIAAAACVLGVAAIADGTARLAFVALGVTLPGLLLQDSWRYAFFALGRGSSAFINDTIWAVLLIPALIALRRTGHGDVFSFVLAWGAAANVAAAVGSVQARFLPRLSGTWPWIVSHRDLGPRYLAENTTNSAASQLRAYGVGVILGLASVGYVQASTTLMGPFLVVLMGTSLVTVPEAAAVLRKSPRQLRKLCVLIAAGLAIVSLAWGAALLIAMPQGLGSLLLRGIWRPTYPLVLPATISVTAACVIVGAQAGLRALGASRRSLSAQIITSAAYVIASLIGAYAGGAVGAVNGTAVAVWLGALAWWWQLHAAMRESGIGRAAGS